MNFIYILFLSSFYFLSQAMDPEEHPNKNAVIVHHHHHRSHSQELRAVEVLGNDKKRTSQMYQIDSSSSSGTEFKDVELGKKTEPIAPASSRIERFAIQDGKRISLSFSVEQVKAAMEKQAEELEASLDLKDSKVLAALHRQMARDILQIVLADEQAHKKHKHVRARLERALKKKHESPRCPEEKDQLDCLRKVSLVQLSARKEKSTKRDQIDQTRMPGRCTPSPRDLFIHTSPHKDKEEDSYSELQKLVMQELAEAGVSERKQKMIAWTIGAAGTVGSALITYLLNRYLGGSGAAAAVTNSTCIG